MAVYTQIDDPSAHFKVQLWTGNATNRSITFDDTDTNMQPDLIWLKNRDGTDWHDVTDALRGVTKSIYPYETDTEDTVADAVTAFGSDGFSIGTNNQVNKNTDKYVSFCWKANGTGSSNTAGSINTTATSANTTAGISIVTYTGDENSSATLGHGLNSVPSMIITKGRTYASSWATYHKAITADYWLQLCETDAKGDVNTIWNDTEPTSTLFTVGSSNQVNDAYNYVAYCFADVQGFSKVSGKYTGNGDSNGIFVPLSFKPAFLMTKRIDGVAGWSVKNNKTDPENPVDRALFANASDAEATNQYVIDFLSNGFKIRDASAGVNGSGNTYIFAAFAEASFVNSKGVPCNAR